VAIDFGPLRHEDLALLAEWFSRPHVSPWWREPYDIEAVTEKYAPCIEGLDKTEVFIISLDNRPVGMAQRYLLSDEPTWRQSLAPSGPHEAAVGIDYLLGEENVTGRGLGAAVIDGFVERAFRRYPEVSEVVVSVLQGNRRSWRALEKAGFVRVWEGPIVSDDPGDEGPSFVYVRRRSRPARP